MQPVICPFGPAFLWARTQRCSSQWAIALRLGYHIRNIQRIERGEYQPGVVLAVRMVAATHVDVGEFFYDLCRKTTNSPTVLATEDRGTSVQISPGWKSARCPFGPLLRHVRVSNGLSQVALAQQAEYSLRNMGVVERGEQEPGVMTALRLVGATGVDVGAFFGVLHSLIREEEGDSAEAPPE